MKTLIDDALRHALDERHIRNFRDVDGDRVYEPKIIVVGVGGAGNNCINRIHRVGIHGVTTVAVNTDKQHLDIIEADKKILIGDDITRGLGAGGDPEIGRRAAEESAHKLQSILKNADLVYVVCGEGGGTGTGAAPVVARIAKRNSSIVVGMVSFPFKTEKSRIEKARKGIIELKNIADTVIVLENDRLLRIVPHLPLEQAFSIADELICHTVKGICETITLPSLINLDFADIKSIMNRGGVAMMTVGEADGANRVDEVVKAAMRSTMLDVDFSGATGALIHITGGEDLTLGEANTIVEKMTKNIAENANVISVSYTHLTLPTN